jgi:hypothetical protein
MEPPRFDFKNIDWLSPKPSKERIIVGVAIIALVAAGFALGQYFDRHKGPSGPGGFNNGPNGGGFAQGGPVNPTQADGVGPTPLTPISAGQCQTFAPAGWRVTDQNQDGTVFTLTSADGSLTGAYAGAAVNAAQAQGLYGPQFRTPETFALYAVSALTHEQAQAMGPEESVGVYKALKFASPNHSGYVLLYTFGVPDPGGYGVIMRIAIGSAADPRSVGVAGAVSAAIRCTATLHPPPQSPPDSETSADHGAGHAGEDGDDLAGTYNAQLGTGWVHDDAGNNYNVDVTSDFHETGPDGPGYYKRNGNDLIKLHGGLS